MRRSVLAALMAATMLAPATANAQEEEGRPSRLRVEQAAETQQEPRPQPPRDRFSDRGDNGEARRASAERFQQARPRLDAQVEAQAQVQVQPQFQRVDGEARGDRRDRGDRGAGGFGDRGSFRDRGGFGDGRPQVQPQPQFQAQPVPVPQQTQPERGRRDWNGGRGYRGGFDGNGGVARQEDRRDDRRDGRGYDRNVQRSDNRGYDNRGERRDFDRGYDRGANGFSAGNGYYGSNGSYGSGNRAWDRDWRRDNRYNYSGYRNQNRNAFRLPRYYAPYGWNYGYRRFTVGFTLSSTLFDQDYWIDDPFYYRLPPAYGPYRWVRYYNDALLVDLRTGYVVDTVYDIFW